MFHLGRGVCVVNYQMTSVRQARNEHAYPWPPFPSLIICLTPPPAVFTVRGVQRGCGKDPFASPSAAPLTD